MASSIQSRTTTVNEFTTWTALVIPVEHDPNGCHISLESLQLPLSLSYSQEVKLADLCLIGYNLFCSYSFLIFCWTICFTHYFPYFTFHVLSNTPLRMNRNPVAGLVSRSAAWSAWTWTSATGCPVRMADGAVTFSRHGSTSVSVRGDTRAQTAKWRCSPLESSHPLGTLSWPWSFAFVRWSVSISRVDT